MGQYCRPCRHPQRAVIDQSILAGEPLSAISARWSISKSSLGRHKVNCLPAVVVKRATGVAKHALALDPVDLMQQTTGTPDAWQKHILASEAQRILMLCSRQAGKSSCAAVLALHQALNRAESLVLLAAPTKDQSARLFYSIMRMCDKLRNPMPVQFESQFRTIFSNGSRILTLSGDETTARGYAAANLVCIDEAVRTPDDLFFSLVPMVATSHGRIIALSSAGNPGGWFHTVWTSKSADWERVKVVATECPRITKETLARDKRLMPPWRYRQEYFCEFGTDESASVFPYALIESLFTDDEPLFAEAIA